jgi:hypothetical protein
VKILGLCLGGGNNEQFFYCFTKYYADSNRWFVNLQQGEGKSASEHNEELLQQIGNKEIDRVIVDFPLSMSHCHLCTIDCPGEQHCPVGHIPIIRKKIVDLLEEDRKQILAGRSRENRPHLSQVRFSSLQSFETEKPVYLLKSLRKRLKKGFSPYFNRNIDFWVWTQYYDQLLKYFNGSYDSFSNLSYSFYSRFMYLKKRFPHTVQFSESRPRLILLELLRQGIVKEALINKLLDHNLATLAKIDLIRIIEKEFNLFIYEHDLEKVVRYPRAMNAVLLTLAGIFHTEGHAVELPNWALQGSDSFFLPRFAKESE